jgi:DNA-directed RNA polymerase subunit RPC12/RpoP
MALIKCPECNQTVSNQAVACPHCGYGIARRPVPQTPTYRPSSASDEFPWRRLTEKELFVLFMGLIGIVIILGLTLAATMPHY